MTTLMAAYKSDGTCIGRCDAKCYNAKGSTCHCIYGGRNHGAGFAKAQKQTTEKFMRMIQEEVEPEDKVIVLGQPLLLKNYFGESSQEDGS